MSPTIEASAIAALIEKYIADQKREKEEKRRKERLEYHREYMRSYFQKPEYHIKQLARMRGLTVEEYEAKKAAGEMKRGRPRKNPVATA